MNMWKKILTGVLAICMVLSLVACGDTSWVYDFGDGDTVSSGLYLTFLMNGYWNVTGSADYDAEKDILKQTIEGMSAEEYIRADAEKAAKEYAAVEKKFDEMGLSLTEADINEINTSLASLWGYYGAVYEENGVAKSTYYTVLENNKKREKIFAKYYGAGGEEAVSDESLMVKFKEDYANVNILRITLATGDSLTSEEKAANAEKKELAESYVKMLNEEGKTFGEISDAYIHYTAGTTHDDSDENDYFSDDDETRIYVKKDSTEYSSKVLDAIFAITPDGDAKMIADEGVYYVVKRYDMTKDGSNFEQMREEVLEDVKGSEFMERIAEWGKATEIVSTNEKSYKKHKPGKLHFDI